MDLIDTHCHIHFPDYELDPDEVIDSAINAGVTKIMCVGCTLKDSKLAVEFAKKYKNVYASIGIHPHEAKDYVNNSKKLQEFHDLSHDSEVKAIGEIGLDYFYNHSDKDSQEKLLKFQLTIAQENNLPVIFHVREAFDDFWPIYDQFKLPGVIHSFSAGKKEIEQILKRNLCIGLNGIMTFTKNQEQLDAVKEIPLNKIVLETDAPFLTPTPYRGTICEPKHVAITAEFLARIRNESIEDFAAATSSNAVALFNL